MKLTDWVYIFSVALQLAGAIVLLFDYLTKKDVDKMMEEEQQAQSVAAESLSEGLKKVEENMKKRYKSKYIVMIRNVDAFIFLVAGYLMSIWAVNGYENKLYIMFWVVTCCVLLCLLACLIAEVLSNQIVKRRDYSKIPEGTIIGIVEAVSSQELDAENVEQKKEKLNIENIKERNEELIRDNKYNPKKSAKEVVALITIGTTGYLIVNEIYRLLFAIDCEKFYGIPRYFFSADVKEKVIYVSLCMILLALFFAPALLRKVMKRNNSDGEHLSDKICVIVVSVILGFAYGSFNILNIDNIPFIRDNIAHDYMGSWMCIILFLSLGIVSVCGMTFLAELVEIKDRKNGKIYWYFYVLSMFITISIFVVGMGNTVTSSVTDKLKYEFIYEGEKNYVVLSEVGNDVLVVEYEESDRMIFYTGSYTLLPRNKYSYEYRILSTTPDIVYSAKPQTDMAEYTGR